MFCSDQRKKLSSADVLKLKREMRNMLPENDPIQNRHNKDECKEYQVHDETNRGAKLGLLCSARWHQPRHRNFGR